MSELRALNFNLEHYSESENIKDDVITTAISKFNYKREDNLLKVILYVYRNGTYFINYTHYKIKDEIVKDTIYTNWMGESPDQNKTKFIEYIKSIE